MADELCLRIEVPVCAFRPYASREYQDTYPVPAPSSVYGMLLSLLGVPREDKSWHRGAEMALALERPPARSKVFRKLRRGKDLENTRPDYQDVLLDLRLWVWLRRGADKADPSLADRVRTGLTNPAGIARFGGLSLGESSYLVDVVAITSPPANANFITPDRTGFYSLPVWTDHSDPARTIHSRFRIEDSSQSTADALEMAWLRIGG